MATVVQNTLQARLAERAQFAADRVLATTATARKTARKAGLAYVGLHVLGYERAVLRVSQIRAARKAIVDDLVIKGEQIEGKALALFGTAKDKVTDGVEDAAVAVENTVKKVMPKGTVKVTQLEAEVKALEVKLAGLKAVKAPAKTLATTPATAKKAVKAATVVATPAVATPVVAAPVANEVIAKAEIEVAAHIAHWDDIKRYDADAKEAYAAAIVKHLGIALKSRDGQLVACSDQAERDTVRDSFLVKKLGVEGTVETLDEKVTAICKMMQADRMKNRVTFYYLLAKQEGKLGAL